MRRIGTCAKCGKAAIVQDHHLHGYSKEHKDDVAPYCSSCDVKAHTKARAEGRCKLSTSETKRQSKYSYQRRTERVKQFYITIVPNIRLVQRIQINRSTENLTIGSYFQGCHNTKLKIISEAAQ